MQATLALGTAGLVGSCKAARRPQAALVAKGLPPLSMSTRRGDLLVSNVFGGGPKKALKREEEPEEYWSSVGERKGANPFKDPLALIGIGAIMFPFFFLAIAIAFGVVDLSAGR